MTSVANPEEAAGTDPPPDTAEATAVTDLELLDQHGAIVHHASASVVESLRYMLARLRVGAEGDVPERLGITSTVPGEGVSFIARTLALLLASDFGRHVCLVDLNWWSPSESVAAAPEGAGVAEVMERTASVERSLVPTSHPTLWVLPAGRVSAAERPGLAHHPELEKLFVELSERFDHVVVDLPALTETSEALVLAESCGCVALVVCQGVTPEATMKQAVDELGQVQLLGVVLNRASTSIPGFVRRRIPGI